MTPADFLLNAGQNAHNEDAGYLSEALQKPLIILSHNAKWEVLSYYYDSKKRRMVIDIQEKGK